MFPFFLGQVQFRDHMLHPLLRVLLEALVSKSHSLLQEEICLGVHSMAAVHFPSYHQQFILHYLSTVEGLSDTHRSLLAQQYKMVEVRLPFPSSPFPLANIFIISSVFSRISSLLET